MGILDAGIVIMDGILKSLRFEAAVTHSAWTGQDGKGRATYAAAVPHQAVVDLTRKQRPTINGNMVTIVATVIILETVTPNGAPGRREPIDPRDIIVLPDGTTGPILDVPGSVVNPDTARPFHNEIMLGEVATAP